jgi:energy-coupling factor transporter ATP-binding protein EcfA2
VHEAGFVHRDFKPDNILIGRNGRPRVTDFGFVRFGKADGDDEESSVRFEGGTLTIPGQVLGTPAYMAPEQIVGDEATAASDQFSFCVALWEALFQRRPFRGTNMAELRKQMLSGQLERPSPRSVVPATVTAVLERGLATMPEDRYPSMAALLEQLEPLLAESGPGPAEEASPYPGLVAFTEDDSDRFFGRDHEITQALGRLHDNAFVAVVGPAGAGKSSLVRAGIIPSLVNSGQSWEIFPIRPGRHPLAELARLLLPLTTGPMDPAAQAKDSGEMIELLGSSPQVFGATLRRRARHYGVSVLIFIDQLEELYTLASAAEREAFVACITQLDDGSHSPLRVIGSIRSDLVDRVGEDRGLLDRLSRGMMFVGPPDGLSLKEALVRPLEIVGYRFEDARLADDIVAELEGRAAALPLLQFAATRLWQGRDRERRLIPRTSYQAMGTVTGALSAHAEQIVAALGADKRALLKAVVTRLVTPDRSADVARIDELHELGATPHEVELLVDSLVDASLLVKRAGESGATDELAHEALIDEWPSLRQWLTQSIRNRSLLTEARKAAASWVASGRSRGSLWGPESTGDARRLLGDCRDQLDGDTQEFLRQSVRRSASGTGRRPGARLLTAFLVLLLVAFAGALVWLQDQRTQAERAAQDARQRAEQAERAARALESRIEALEESRTGR